MRRTLIVAALAASGTLAPFAAASGPARAAPIAGARYHGAIRAAHAGKLALGLTLSADRRSFELPGARDWQGSHLVASRSLPCVGRAEWALDGRAGTLVAGARFRVRRTASHGRDTLRLAGHFAGRRAIARLFLGSERHGSCAFRGRIVMHVTHRLRGSCRPRRTRTLALSGRGRVFDETDRDDLGGSWRNAYGCAFRSRKRFFLSEDERPDAFVAAAATAGSLAATASYSCPLDCGAGVNVIDLASGRTVRSGFVDQFCNQSQEEPPEVSALVLAASGSYAYIARGFEQGTKPTVNDVVKNVAGKETLLDCGKGIAPHSLTLRDSTLRWSDGGQARTAPLDAPARQARAATRITVAASGDFLVHQPVWQRARVYGHGRRYDFRPMFRKVRPLIAGADLALCHVETPFSYGPPRGYPSFRTPPALAAAIKATGWDACSTASNHTLDNGQKGVNTTLRVLEKVGLRHAGSHRSRAGTRRPTILDVKGVKIGFLAYTALTNGQRIPHPWSLDMARARRIVRDARRARKAGAEAVIVNLHWGNEFHSRPSAAQRKLAAALTRSKAITAVVGQHVHVVQPIRWMHGKPVVFGEGNLISNQTAACCSAATQDGLIALLDLEHTTSGTRATRVRYLPTYVRHPDFTVVHAHGRSRSRTIGIAGRSKRVVPIR